MSMDLCSSRQASINALVGAGLDFPQDATLSQPRELCELTKQEGQGTAFNASIADMTMDSAVPEGEDRVDEVDPESEPSEDKLIAAASTSESTAKGATSINTDAEDPGDAPAAYNPVMKFGARNLAARTAANTSAANSPAANTSATKISVAIASAANISAAKISAANIPAAENSAVNISAAKMYAANASAAKTSAAQTEDQSVYGRFGR